MFEHKIYLNGEWEFMPLYDVECSLDLPQDLVYEEQKIRVPSSWLTTNMSVRSFTPFRLNDYPEEWGKAKTAVYHRTFTLPQDTVGQRIFLNLTGVMERARVYLNKKQIADWSDSFLTGRFDITDDVCWERENDLHIVITTYESVTIYTGAKKVLNPAGSWMRSAVRGLWNDVYLDVAPNVRVEDITMRTYFRGMKLESIVRVRNNTYDHQKLTAKATVWDGSTVAKVLPSQEFVVPCQGEQTVLFAEKWEDAILWDTDNPHLYQMEISLYDGEELVHKTYQRFGFREIWTEGPNFILNGKRINLRGDSWHFQGAVQMTKQFALNWYRMCLESGVNYIRLHAEPHPDFYLDAADETGMLIVDESAIYGSGGSMAAGDPLFIENCRQHIRHMVERDKNHPSIIFWSLQNEMRWVKGRNDFKKYEVEFHKIYNTMDPTRKVSMDGDNRLIDYKDSQLESLHYNIDGTLAQWRREKPLTLGEHCAMWYLNPQNAAQYLGMRVYHGFDECVVGAANRERIFVEYARRHGVSGISSFNFANYFMHSMPDNDVELTYDTLEGPGNKPMKIPRFALTLNNGMLPDYPNYRPNPSLAIMRSAYRAVTILPQELDRVFYDDREIRRIYNVYNDTRDDQNCTIAYTIRWNGQPIQSDKLTFVQSVGERYDWELVLPRVTAEEPGTMTVTAVLYHGAEEKFVLEKEYKIYPATLKSTAIGDGSAVAFYGKDAAYAILETLLPGCTRLSSIPEINNNYRLLVLGDHLDEKATPSQPALEEFVANGGQIVQLEQYDFAMGDAMLQNLAMFSAQISSPEHPVLKGLTEEDFSFWHPGLVEDIPDPIAHQVFVKSWKGDMTYILECSSGDWADGGELWTPLVEYNYEKGTVLMNQMALVENYDTIPQAGILLRNLLTYALEKAPKTYQKVGILADDASATFLLKTGLVAEKAEGALEQYALILAQASSLSEEDGKALSAYLQQGGKVLFLPTAPEESEKLSAILGKKVTVTPSTVYHLEKMLPGGVTAGIAYTDLYRYDKIPMSPRPVKNTILAENTVVVEDGVALIKDVPGTPWHDYYENKFSSEHSRIAMVSLNRAEAQPEKYYMAQVAVGAGQAILSQLCMDIANEKDLRVYTRLVSNLGGTVLGDLFSYEKSNLDYSMDYIMSLPLQPYDRYETMRDYFVDPQYSLNNLGEGEYGWMLKLEKNREDGTVTAPNSANQTIFMSCFVDHPGEDIPCRAELLTNASTELWFNGELIRDLEHLTLRNGVNRVILISKCGEEDLKVRLVFTHPDGEPVKKLLCHLTIDEVDPK